jgi:hypothetical protein
MKKLLTLAALLGAASLSFGQGTVNFSAGAAASTRISTNSVYLGASTGAISSPRDSFYFALFVAPTNAVTSVGSAFRADPTTLGYTFTGLIGTNSGVLGRLTGNNSDGVALVPGYATSASGNFIVVGWSANLGASWAAVQTWLQNYDANGIANAYYGSSQGAFSVQLGGGAIPAGGIFGGGVGQIAGFTLGLAPVPEPSTFALAGLGAAALLIFRRRK